MSTITNTGIITSFGRTPQANDDTFTGLINEDAAQTIYLDVMANDLGGLGKSLYSLDNAASDAASAKGPYAPQDLLARDAVGADNFSKAGALIEITADGKVAYTMTAASTASFQSLAQGEIGTDTFTYAIQMGNGTISWATATVQIMGTNDAPVAVADVNSGFEDTLIEGSVADNDYDVDNGATLTYSLNGDQDPVAGLTFNDDGSYSLNAGHEAYQYLAAGQKLVVVVNYTVTDEYNATSTSTLTITVIGTYDAPPSSGDPALNFIFNRGTGFPQSGQDNTAEGFTANDTLTLAGYGAADTLVFSTGYFVGDAGTLDTMFVIANTNGNGGSNYTNTGYLVDYTGLDSTDVTVTGQAGNVNTDIVITGL